MKKDVRYFLFNLIMDGVNAGLKYRGNDNDIANYQNVVANQIMKKHGIDMDKDWLLEEQEYLDMNDDDLYSMADISVALIENIQQFVDNAPEKISKVTLDKILHRYMFAASDYLKERND